MELTDPTDYSQVYRAVDPVLSAISSRANLKPPQSTGFGTTLDERPADEWTEVDGYRFWHSPFEVTE